MFSPRVVLMVAALIVAPLGSGEMATASGAAPTHKINLTTMCHHWRAGDEAVCANGYSDSNGTLKQYRIRIVAGYDLPYERIMFAKKDTCSSVRLTIWGYGKSERSLLKIVTTTGTYRATSKHTTQASVTAKTNGKPFVVDAKLEANANGIKAYLSGTAVCASKTGV